MEQKQSRQMWLVLAVGVVAVYAVVYAMILFSQVYHSPAMQPTFSPAEEIFERRMRGSRYDDPQAPRWVEAAPNADPFEALLLDDEEARMVRRHLQRRGM